MKKCVRWSAWCVVMVFACAAFAAAEPIVVTDFEDTSMVISTYQGPESSVTTRYVSDPVHEGKNALLVQNKTKDYTGALITVASQKANWSSHTTFSMWVKGGEAAKGKSFNVIVEDANIEQFSYTVKIDWDDWKQISIPLEQFISRTDWQHPNAKVDQVIDYPVKTFHFCAVGGEATFDVYFDLFEVTGERQAPAAAVKPPKEIKAPKFFGFKLRTLADKQARFIGAAVEPDFLNDQIYADLLASQFNFLTPENHMKWQFIHPEQDRYDFTGGDKLVEFAQQHNMKVRGHTLVWHFKNPAWLEQGTWTQETLSKVLEDHIKTVAGHYKGKLYAWDVVNEPLNEYGAMRESIWFKIY